jgi:hypothetical protein
MQRPSNRSAGSESGRRIAREPDKENASLLEENERLQALLHLLLGHLVSWKDASAWGQ